MKTINKGEQWWVGITLECGFCGAAAQVEERDRVVKRHLTCPSCSQPIEVVRPRKARAVKPKVERERDDNPPEELGAGGSGGGEGSQE